MVLIYVLILWMVVVGFASFGVDWGMVQLTKSELLHAADAGARAAAQQFSSGITATQNAAVTWAGKNSAAGTAVVLSATNDVEFGTWDPSAKTFTPLAGAARSSANAIRITCRRTAANGNALKLMWGGLVGMNSIDLHGSAIAISGNLYPIVGLSTFTMSGNAYTDSYNSSSGSYGSQTPGALGSVTTNANYTLGASIKVNGNLHYGTGSAPPNGTVTGSRSKLPGSLSYTATPLPATYTEHGAISLNGNGTLTLATGNHHLTSLTANPSHCKLILNATSGPVRVWCDGNFYLGDSKHTIQTTGNIPANFELHMPNASTIDIPASGQTFGLIDAPKCTLNLNGSELFGTVVVNQITMGAGDAIHYDAAATQTFQVVQ